MQPTISVTPIEYRSSSAEWFTQVRHLPFAIWLDSGQSGYGRWDILSAAPCRWLETKNGITWIKSAQDGAEPKSHKGENPFELLKLEIFGPSTNFKTILPLDIPFCGGALGYFAYDLVKSIEPKLTKYFAEQDADVKNNNQPSSPEMLIGIYSWAILQDHQQKEAWLVINSELSPDYNFSRIQAICDEKKSASSNSTQDENFKLNPFTAEMTFDDYQKKFEKIRAYIQAGDTYQVNFAQRFCANYSGDSFSAYLKLREALPSPFSAYMALPQGSLLSLSPERFIKLSGKIAETQPIKGTIARGKNPAEDQAQAKLLQTSLKDRAENLMIVDLLRNDLSRTCNKVLVPKLFELQSFANVHHLVSTVTAELKDGQTAVDLLANAFPGGSITGAPKIRSMEIIAELETETRSLYCGSIGYISSCGNMDTNIAIRTLVCDQDKIYCWGGGGIVADSVCEDEYQESIAKVKILMDTLEKYFCNSQ